MIVKKGTIREEKQLEETVSEITTATIIEKTDGNYVEILFCMNRVLDMDGDIASVSTSNTFDVYYGKTIAEILTLNGIVNYTWTEELTQIS